MAYRHSFAAPFLFDDLLWTAEGHQIRHLTPLSSFFTGSSRPVLFLSLAVNFALGGLDPRGYHLLNLLVHAAAGLTLFGLVRRSLNLLTPGLPMACEGEATAAPHGESRLGGNRTLPAWRSRNSQDAIHGAAVGASRRRPGWPLP